MKRSFLRLLLPLFACAMAAGQSPSVLIIHDVTVIDTTGGPAQAHRSVFVSAGRVADIVASEKLKKADIGGASWIDGKGKFLIPGLWDMHVHMVFGDWFPHGKKLRCRCSSRTALPAYATWVAS